MSDTDSSKPSEEPEMPEVPEIPEGEAAMMDSGYSDSGDAPLYMGKSRFFVDSKPRRLPVFIRNLWDALENPLYRSMACWGPSFGSEEISFIVLDENEFSEHVLPRILKFANYAIFLRHLTEYGFERVECAQGDAFYHAQFRRNAPYLLRDIVRDRHRTEQSTLSPTPAYRKQKPHPNAQSQTNTSGTQTTMQTIRQAPSTNSSSSATHSSGLYHSASSSGISSTSSTSSTNSSSASPASSSENPFQSNMQAQQTEGTMDGSTDATGIPSQSLSIQTLVDQLNVLQIQAQESRAMIEAMKREVISSKYRQDQLQSIAMFLAESAITSQKATLKANAAANAAENSAAPFNNPAGEDPNTSFIPYKHKPLKVKQKNPERNELSAEPNNSEIPLNNGVPQSKPSKHRNPRQSKPSYSSSALETTDLQLKFQQQPQMQQQGHFPAPQQQEQTEPIYMVPPPPSPPPQEAFSQQEGNQQMDEYDFQDQYYGQHQKLFPENQDVNYDMQEYGFDANNGSGQDINLETRYDSDPLNDSRLSPLAGVGEARLEDLPKSAEPYKNNDNGSSPAGSSNFENEQEREYWDSYFNN